MVFLLLTLCPDLAGGLGRCPGLWGRDAALPGREILGQAGRRGQVLQLQGLSQSLGISQEKSSCHRDGGESHRTLPLERKNGAGTSMIWRYKTEVKPIRSHGSHFFPLPLAIALELL